MPRLLVERVKVGQGGGSEGSHIRVGDVAEAFDVLGRREIVGAGGKSGGEASGGALEQAGEHL